MELIKVLYIDPGTGGMLFTVLFGIFGVLVFSLPDAEDQVLLKPR